MAKIKRMSLFGKLNSLAYKAIESGTVFCKIRGNPYVELVHWLHQILQLYDSDLHRIIRYFNVNPKELARDVIETLDRLPAGATSITDISAIVEDLTESAWLYATLMFDVYAIRSGHLIIGALKVSNLKNHLYTISSECQKINLDVLTDNFLEIVKDSPEDDMSSHDGSAKPRRLSPKDKEIFICYRRSDTSHVTGRIYDRIVAKFGKERVFKDVNSIPLGARDFSDEIKNQLKTTRALLVVIVSQWLTSVDEAGRRRLDKPDDFVRLEVEFGLSNNIQVIPLLIDGIQMPEAKALPRTLKPLSKCQAAKVRGDPEFEWDIELLVRHLSNYLDP